MTVLDEIIKAKAEAIDALVGADDVWTDYGSGFRVHFSFGPGSDMKVVERLMTARALTASLKEDTINAEYEINFMDSRESK